MGVVLEKRIGKNGDTTFRLVIHHDGKRWRESIDGLKISKTTNLVDKQENKIILAVRNHKPLKDIKALSIGTFRMKLVPTTRVLLKKFVYHLL